MPQDQMKDVDNSHSSMVSLEALNAFRVLSSASCEQLLAFSEGLSYNDITVRVSKKERKTY